MPYYPSGPDYITLTALNQSAGDLALSDGYWGVSDSILQHINVHTDSTDWDMWIFPDSNFDLDDPRTASLVSNGLGNLDIENNDSYHSVSDSVYVRYTDNSGSNTASFYITGLSI